MLRSVRRPKISSFQAQNGSSQGLLAPLALVGRRQQPHTSGKRLLAAVAASCTLCCTLCDTSCTLSRVGFLSGAIESKGFLESLGECSGRGLTCRCDASFCTISLRWVLSEARVSLSALVSSRAGRPLPVCVLTQPTKPPPDTFNRRFPRASRVAVSNSTTRDPVLCVADVRFSGSRFCAHTRCCAHRYR